MIALWKSAAGSLIRRGPFKRFSTLTVCVPSGPSVLPILIFTFHRVWMYESSFHPSSLSSCSPWKHQGYIVVVSLVPRSIPTPDEHCWTTREPPVIPLTSHSASLSNEKLIQYCALIFSLLSPLFFFSKQRRKVCRLVNNQLLIKNICIECALKNWRKKETKKTFIGNSISSLFPAIEWNLFPVKETRSELKVLERSRKC
jgi:hypothetical protein